MFEYFYKGKLAGQELIGTFVRAGLIAAALQYTQLYIFVTFWIVKFGVWHSFDLTSFTNICPFLSMIKIKKWKVWFLQKSRAQSLLPVTAAIIQKADYNATEDVFRFEGVEIHQVSLILRLYLCLLGFYLLSKMYSQCSSTLNGPKFTNFQVPKIHILAV